MPEKTLDAMAAGGMYDLVGGGFHRYSVDRKWLVPHFEKMLYDNAQLAVSYLHGWQTTGKARYRTIVEQTLGTCSGSCARGRRLRLLAGRGHERARGADVHVGPRTRVFPDELLHSFEGGRFILRGQLDETGGAYSSSSCASSGRSPHATTRRSPPGTG